MLSSAMLSATAVATAHRSGGMFGGPIMAGIANRSMAILRLVGVKMVIRLRAALRVGTMVSVTRIVAVVDMAIKSAGTVKPGSGANE
jgi:hypothetical protein